MTFPPFASVYLIHRLVGKESACDAGDPGSIPGLGRSSGEGTDYLLQYSWASLVAQLVKNPSAVWETWVRSLGWENSLGKGKATPLQYSGLENSMTVQSMGLERVGSVEIRDYFI